MLNIEKINNLRWKIIHDKRSFGEDYVLKKYEQEVILMNSPELSLWFITYFNTPNLYKHVEIIINSNNKELVMICVDIVHLIKKEKERVRR